MPYKTVELVAQGEIAILQFCEGRVGSKVRRTGAASAYSQLRIRRFFFTPPAVSPSDHALQHHAREN
jgi:hypothetical protein